MINISDWDFLHIKSCLCNRISVRCWVTPVSASVSRSEEGIDCSLPPKCAVSCLRTEAGYISHLDKGHQKVVAWGKWNACAVVEVGFQGCEVAALPEH